MNSSKRLFLGDHCPVIGWEIAQFPMFSSLLLAFPGTVYSGVFQCASAGIVGSLPPRVQVLLIYLQSHDLLAANVQGNNPSLFMLQKPG